MEAYDPTGVQLHRPPGRYAFGNQPDIAYVDLARLAEALLPLVADDAEQAVAMAARSSPPSRGSTRSHLLRGQRVKLGLRRGAREDEAPLPRWRRTGWPCCTPSRWILRSGWRTACRCRGR